VKLEDEKEEEAFDYVINASGEHKNLLTYGSELYSNISKRNQIKFNDFGCLHINTDTH